MSSNDEQCDKKKKSNVYLLFLCLRDRVFGKMAKKTFDSGTTRLPATDLGIYADLT